MPPNPAKLIESQAMEGVIDESRSTYDLVVIDTPPLGVVSDAFPLLRKVDGVIVVGRGGRNRRDVAQRLHETLTAAGAPLLGVVANGFSLRRLRSYDRSYGRAHRDGYAGAQAISAQPSSGNGAVSSDRATAAKRPHPQAPEASPPGSSESELTETIEPR